MVLGQPLKDIGRVEGLWPDALRVDAAADEGVDHVARVLLLRVAVEGHRDLRGRLLELGGEVPVAGERVDERDVAVERHDGAAGVVELGPPYGRPVLIVLGCLGARVEAVLLAAQSLVLCGRDVAGAAERIGGRGGVGGREGHGALGSQFGLEENVGRCMQIAQRVSAHEAKVASERDVAFEDASAHARASHCSLDRLFGELKRAAAAMANGEVGGGEGTVLASLKLVLEG